MTGTERWNNQALALAHYYATRAIAMAVVAFVGLILASVVITAILVLVIAADPSTYLGWVNGVGSWV